MDKYIIKNIRTSIALFVVAMFVLSCEKPTPPPTITDPEATPTKISLNLRSMESVDGKRTYRMETPLVEEFEEASEPYVEFKKGGRVEIFAEDSVTIESSIVTDYAHNNKVKQLWEARGNVVYHNYKDDISLFTQQLFWDEKKQRIYTDKPAKVIQKGNVHYGIGFESDKDMNVWQFKRARGSLDIEEARGDSVGEADSLSADSLQSANVDSLSVN